MAVTVHALEEQADHLRANLATAREIRVAMARKGVNQTWVAEAIGMKTSSLSRRMKGKTPFTLPELVDIARVLDVEPGALVKIRCFSVSDLPAGAFALELFDDDGEPIDFFARAPLASVG